MNFPSLQRSGRQILSHLGLFFFFFSFFKIFCSAIHLMLNFILFHLGFGLLIHGKFSSCFWMKLFFPSVLGLGIKKWMEGQNKRLVVGVCQVLKESPAHRSVWQYTDSEASIICPPVFPTAWNTHTRQQQTLPRSPCILITWTQSSWVCWESSFRWFVGSCLFGVMVQISTVET